MQKKNPDWNCHRLQCKSLFNVANLVNGMWKVAPEKRKKNNWAGGEGGGGGGYRKSYVYNTLLACPIRATVISWSFKMLTRIWLLHAPDNQASAYGTAKKKRPGYLVGNLVATNWPIEKALHAIGYNQIPTKLPNWLGRFLFGCSVCRTLHVWYYC